MAVSEEPYDSSNEDVDLALNISFEELRLKIRFDNVDTAIVIDCNHYFLQYPSFNLETYLQSSFKQSKKQHNVASIKVFQSTYNFATKDNKIHRHILTKNRKARRKSYFEQTRNELYSIYQQRQSVNDTPSPSPSMDSQRIQSIMIQSLPQWVAGCNSNKAAVQLDCTQKIRKLLSIQRCPPIDTVIDSGVVPRIIQFLQCNNRQKLQFEAAWTITNIASGDAKHTQYIVDNGAVPIFIELLSSKCIAIQEQSAWGLGNIAGDSVQCRDVLLEHNVLHNLIPLLFDIECRVIALRRTATWTLSNLCRGEASSFHMIYVKQIMDVLNKLLLLEDQDQDQDEEILQDVLWSYTYLFAKCTNIVIGNECGYLLKTELLIYGYLRVIRDTELDSMRIPQDIATMLILFAPIADIYIPRDVLKKLIQLLAHSSVHILTCAVTAIHDILDSKTQNNKTRQLCIDYGIMKELEYVLKNGNLCVQRKVCSLINNMVTDAPHSIIDVIVADGVFDIIMRRKDALFVVDNVMRHGNKQHIKIMAEKGLIGAIGNMNEPIMAIMQCMEKIIEVEDGKYIEIVKECGKFLSLLKGSMFEHGTDSAETRHRLLVKLNVNLD